MKLGCISAYKLDTERALSLAVSISLKTKVVRSYFRVPGTAKYPPSSANKAKVAQNHDARKGVSATLSVLK